jgi:DNA repair protein RadD
MITVPRYYQSQANDAVWKFLAEQPGNPIVVLPTGAGKSFLAAMIVNQCIEFGGRAVVLAHRRELLQQNLDALKSLLPNVSAGIYSAGLKSRDTQSDVVFAGIQSVYRKALELGERSLIIIDECHLVSSDDETMYGQFLADVKLGNPRQRVAGMSATPYRTGSGPLCGRNKLFQKICYEAYTGDLIQQGFLCPITNRPADKTVDTSLIKMRGGEFIENEMQSAFDTTDNVSAACKEIVAKCQGRHSILVFAAGVAHAEHVAETIRQNSGEVVGIVTGETFAMERSATLADFKRGSLRWLVNCDVLTTGFDAPCIDAICVLRATMSPGLFAQIVGRGLRKHESKTEVLVLDYGENLKRFGSLDDPNYGRSSAAFTGTRTSPAENNGRGKECPNCGQDVAARSAECEDCGFIFPVKHESQADHESAITGQTPPETWTVNRVTWARHTKKGGGDAPPTLRIDYDCTKGEGDMKQTISEYICLEHTGYARTKAGLWWQARSLSYCPNDVSEAIDMLDRGACRMPVTITTEMDGKYFRIKSVEFAEDKPETWREADEPVELLSEGGFDDDVPF